jgi:hypothetical protein
LLLIACLVACSAESGGSGGTGGTGNAGAGGVAGGGAAGGWPNGGASGSGGTAGSGASGGTAGTSGAGGTGVDPCEPIPGASYATSPTVGPITDRPAPDHADLNMKLRGWSKTGGTLGLVAIEGPTDALAPKLNTLFTDDRVPTFVQNYRVNNWDWGTNSVAGPITEWEVTLSGFASSAGEVLELPNSGYEIGPGHEARVLYADDDSITFKYTSEDNVVYGYAIHVVGVCVEPTLRSLYDSNDAAGRGDLPALAGNQPFGRSRGAEVLVAIRDTGAFMDPRAEKDWW